MGSDPISLNEFSDQLRRLVGADNKIRPLVCQGNPLTCTVALVGINPHSKIPFWDSWSGGEGMNRDGWLKTYLAENGRFGRSRLAINRLVDYLDPIRMIELNAYVAPSNRLADLEQEQRSTKIFEFILNVVQPSVIVSAGKTAHRVVAAIVKAWKHEVIEARHFIYWGREYEAALALEIAPGNSYGSRGGPHQISPSARTPFQASGPAHQDRLDHPGSGREP